MKIQRCSLLKSHLSGSKKHSNLAFNTIVDYNTIFLSLNSVIDLCLFNPSICPFSKLLALHFLLLWGGKSIYCTYSLMQNSFQLFDISHFKKNILLQWILSVPNWMQNIILDMCSCYLDACNKICSALNPKIRTGLKC